MLQENVSKQLGFVYMTQKGLYTSQFKYLSSHS